MNTRRRKWSGLSNSFSVQALESRVLLAATPVQLRDINQTTDMLGPDNLTQVGSVAYFAGHNSGTDGMELFKTDGTKAGTVLVKDINPGSASSELVNLTNVNGALFFAATDGTSGRELWKSDGTAAGTVRVKDIHPTSGSFPTNLRAVGNTLYFTADNGTGNKLWKSDGTEAGTISVSNDSQVTQLTAFGNKLLYTTGSSSSRVLKTIDSAGTTTTISSTLNATAPFVMGGVAYFFAGTGTGGSTRGDLYQTDGTATGTSLVKAINYTASGFDYATLSTANSGLIVNGNVTYFRAGDGISAKFDLWRTDGTAAGTYPLIADGSFTSTSYLNPIGANSVMFARTTSAHGTEPWISDGTVVGTKMLEDLLDGMASGLSGGLSMVASHLPGVSFFATNADLGSAAIYRTDGTALGTGRLTGLQESAGYIIPLGAVGDSVLFNGARYAGTGELFRSDGTAAGTYRLGATTAGNGNGLFDYQASVEQSKAFARVGETMYFSATDGLTGQELWRTDPALGAVRVADIAPGGVGSDPAGFIVAPDGTLYFSAYKPVYGREMYRLTPGSNTPQMLTTNLVNEPRYGAVIGENLYFNAGKLYRYAPSTGLVQELGYANNQLFSPFNFTVVGDELYFSASSSSYGSELFKVDDSAKAVPQLVKDIYTGSVPVPSPRPIGALGSKLLFVAGDGIAGRELWITDGTADGTTRLTDLNAGSASAEFDTAKSTGSAEVNGVLYFSVDPDGGNNYKLYRTDGTTASTRQVGNVESPSQFAASNGRLFFVAGDSATPAGDRSAYRSSDADPEAFIRLTNPTPNGGTFTATGLHVNGDNVFVLGYPGTNIYSGLDLYQAGLGADSGQRVGLATPVPRSDGYNPITSGSYTLGMYSMASNSSNLYFPLYSPATGLEPGKLNFAEEPPQPPPAGPYSFTGIVYNDINRDGQYTGVSQEIPASNRTVWIDVNNDGDIDTNEPTFFTNLFDGSGGQFRFSNLAAGQYHVRTLLPPGWIQTSPADGGPVMVTLGGTIVSVRIGTHNTQQVSTIRGTVYSDTDLDGFKDSGEPGVSGRTVYVDADNDGVLDSGELTTTTDSNGAYVLTPYNPSTETTYTIRQVLPSNNWVQTSPSNNAGRNVTIAPNTATFGHDFGTELVALPVANAGRDMVAPEGGAVALSSSVVSNVPIAAHEYDFDFDGVNFSSDWHIGLFAAGNIDGPATRTVGYRVRDTYGRYSAIDTMTVSIYNVAPTADSFTNNGPTTISSPSITVTFNNPTDRAPADVNAGLRYSYDFNNDGTFDLINSTSPSASVPANFLNFIGTRTVAGRISDKDGAGSTYTTQVTVNGSPEIAVDQQGTTFADGNWNVNFANVGYGGAPAQRLFTVRNTGSETLTLGALALPAGFSIVEPLASSIASGQMDTFTLQLDSDVPGAKSGTVSFATNDADENPFDFTVSGNVAGSSISGAVYNDTNADGVFNGTDVPLPDRPVYIDANGNGSLDIGEQQVATDANGGYSLTNLLAGTYTVRTVLPDNFSYVLPANGANTVTVAAGQSVSGWRFALRENPIVQPDPITLRAIADAYVRDGSSAAQNFGGVTELVVKRNNISSGTRETYLRFSMSDFTGANSAVLRLFGRSNTSGQAIALAAYGAADVTWSEGSINWNNKPATGTTPLASHSISGTTNVWYEFDVTAYVQQQRAAGATAVTFVLKSTAIGDAQALFSSDEATANRPQLVVTPNSEPVRPTWLASGSAATWNPATKTLTITGPTTLTADPGADRPLITASGSAAVLTINPASGLQVRIGSLTLSNGASATLTSLGASRSASNHRVLVIDGGLSIDASSKLDLTDNDLVLKSATLAAAQSLITTGFHNGDWLGTGLTSSAAANEPNGLTALGFLSNAELGASTFSGVTGLDSDDILIKYTYYGDADLSGHVTLDDFNQFLNGYQNPGVERTWLNGDFDFSGAVTLDDFNQFLFGYQNWAGVL